MLDHDKGQRFLTQDERGIVVEALMETKQQSFDTLRSKLGFSEDMTFNTERGGRDKLKGHETDSAMSSKNGVGKRWRKLSDDVKDNVISICLIETQDDVAVRRLVGECGLTEEEAIRLPLCICPKIIWDSVVRRSNV